MIPSHLDNLWNKILNPTGTSCRYLVTRLFHPYISRLDTSPTWAINQLTNYTLTSMDTLVRPFLGPGYYSLPGTRFRHPFFLNACFSWMMFTKSLHQKMVGWLFLTKHPSHVKNHLNFRDSRSIYTFLSKPSAKLPTWMSQEVRINGSDQWVIKTNL